MAAPANKPPDLFEIFEIIDSAYLHAKRIFAEVTGTSLWSFRWLQSIGEHPDLSAKQHIVRMRIPRDLNPYYHVSRLADKGWIERWKPKEGDKRAAYYRITPSGKGALKEITGKREQALKSLFADPHVLRFKTALSQMKFTEFDRS